MRLLFILTSIYITDISFFRKQMLIQMPLLGFPIGIVIKDPLAKAGDTGFVPWVGKIPRRRNWQLLQYSCLETPRAEEPRGLQSMEEGGKESDMSDRVSMCARTVGQHAVKGDSQSEVQILYMLKVTFVEHNSLWVCLGLLDQK